MANRPAAALVLHDDDRPRLLAMTRSPSVRAGLAQRARILLLAADGLSNTEIADKVGVSRPTVLTWRQRYAEHGLAGLDDRARPGRRPQVSTTEVLEATLARPPRRLGVSHWSSRLLGEDLGVGRGAVVRAWHTHGLQPVRGGFRFATTPQLVGRAVAVLALRLGPPESFVVLDIREPARAADRADDTAAAGALPDLTAALRRSATSVPDDPGGALLGFLDEINRSRARWPTASRLHLVADGSGPVGLPALREALAVRSRVVVHQAQQVERWPDLVAGWLAMTAQGEDHSEARACFERVRRGLGAGEVFTWTHAPGRTPLLRRRPSETSANVK